MPNILWNSLKHERRRLFFLTLQGKREWQRLVKTYELNKSSGAKKAVILLPKNDAVNSYFSLLYLDRMLSLNDYQSAIVLARTDIDKEVAPFFCHKIEAVEKVSDSTSEALLQFYAALPFDSRFVCTSLTDVKCRDGEKLLGVCGITIEEMVAIGIYHIIPFVRKPRPVYIGDNPAAKEFFSLGGKYVPFRTDLKIR